MGRGGRGRGLLLVHKFAGGGHGACSPISAATSGSSTDSSPTCKLNPSSIDKGYTGLMRKWEWMPSTIRLKNIMWPQVLHTVTAAGNDLWPSEVASLVAVSTVR